MMNKQRRLTPHRTPGRSNAPAPGGATPSEARAIGPGPGVGFGSNTNRNTVGKNLPPGGGSTPGGGSAPGGGSTPGGGGSAPAPDAPKPTGQVVVSVVLARPERA